MLDLLDLGYRHGLAPRKEPTDRFRPDRRPAGVGIERHELLVDPALPKTICRLEVLDIPGVWGRRDASGRAPAELNGRE